MGGLAGHMNHISDKLFMKKSEIQILVDDIINGQYRLVEKTDGFNIFAIFNGHGDVTFARNIKDIMAGGFTINDIAERWKKNNFTQNVYLTAAKYLFELSSQLDFDFIEAYNDKHEDYIWAVNCECIIPGRTNLVYYSKDKVILHNICIYSKKEPYLDPIILPISVDFAGSDLTPNNDLVMIFLNAIGLSSPALQQDNEVKIRNVSYKNIAIAALNEKLNKLMGNENITIFDLFAKNIERYIRNNYKLKDSNIYSFNNPEFQYLVTRILCGTVINKRDLIKLYEIQYGVGDEIKQILDDEKQIRELAKYDFQLWEIEFGNIVIEMGDLNFIISTKERNQTSYYINCLLEDIENGKNISDKIWTEYSKFKNTGSQINAYEGVVFDYNGELIKLTGSFAPLNQIHGALRYG